MYSLCGLQNGTFTWYAEGERSHNINSFTVKKYELQGIVSSGESQNAQQAPMKNGEGNNMDVSGKSLKIIDTCQGIRVN